MENKKINKDKLKIELEQKLLEIEKNKSNIALNNNSNTKIKDSKIASELRKEFEQLQKTKKTIIDSEKIKVEKDSSSKIKTSIIEEKPLKKEISSNNIIENKKNQLQKTVSEKKEAISSELKEVIKGETVKAETTKSQKVAEIIPKKEVKPKIKVVKQKSTTINKTANKSSNKKTNSNSPKSIIFIIIALVFAVIFLGYYYKLRTDLEKTKEALEKKKQEQIDYSKKDAIFKEVEDDVEPEDLQDIK